MITRTTRPPTPAEIEILTRPPIPEPSTRGMDMFAASGFGLVGAGLALLIGALAFNFHLLPPKSHVVLIVLLIVTGVFAAWFLWRAARSLLLLVIGPAKPPPAMTQSEARAVRLTSIRIPADGVWWIDVGDDDVPWLLVRSGERYVSIYSQALDDEESGAETSEGGWAGPVVTVVMRGEYIWAVRYQSAARDAATVVVGYPTIPDGKGWWTAEYAELGRSELWPELAREIGAG